MNTKQTFIKNLLKVSTIITCGYIFNPLMLIASVMGLGFVEPFYIFYTLLLGIIAFRFVTDTLTGKIIYTLLVISIWIFITYSPILHFLINLFK